MSDISPHDFLWIFSVFYDYNYLHGQINAIKEKQIIVCDCNNTGRIVGWEEQTSAPASTIGLKMILINVLIKLQKLMFRCHKKSIQTNISCTAHMQVAFPDSSAVTK